MTTCKKCKGPNEGRFVHCEKCRATHRVHAAAYYAANPARARAANRAWYLANAYKHKEVDKAYNKAHPKQYLLKSAKVRARRKGLEFDLADTDFDIPEVCPLLGIELAPAATKLQPGSPTLDRIDSSRGYVRGNVWVVSHRGNTIKSDATPEELERVAAAVRARTS